MDFVFIFFRTFFCRSREFDFFGKLASILAMAIQAGDIALTMMPDSKSKAKERPVLVLVVYGLDCLVVAITSLFDADNIKPNEIKLPVKDVTNLWKESVVACDWREVVLLNDLRFHGRVALVLARARRIILNR